MMNTRKHFFAPILVGALALAGPAAAQGIPFGESGLTLTGSLQSDILVPQNDAAIGTEKYAGDVVTNSYLDLALAYKEYLTVGARLEYLDYPLPGFENDFAGWGVPYFYLTGRCKWGELTLGDFYDQFGSGLIFRTYEERSLGIDNSLRGARAVLRPVNGLNIKLLGGKQRRYWEHNDSWVWGADAELNIDQWSKRMQENGTVWMLGGSYVSKYEQASNMYGYIPGVDGGEGTIYRYNLPEVVPAFDVRTQFQKSGFNVLAEYAWKINDPSFDNNYSYDKGTAALLSASYSRRGMSILVQAKRSENMSYRSARDMTGTSSFINHLPAFAYQHTYALPALYPYATQPLGEWAYQAEFTYNFRRRTTLGGRYGTNLKVNFSHIRALHKDEIPQGGEDATYYQDINVTLEKKWTKDFKTILMYMNQRYNQQVVEGHNNNGMMVKSNIYVFEGQYHFNKKLALRMELQYLNTKQDQGDWLYGLLEFSVNPSWMITVSDMYNAGETNLHYYQAAVTYTHAAHRLQAGYARTRAGYNCSGGVCRYVPASKGVQVSYNFSF